MDDELAARIEAITGVGVTSSRPLGGGCVADVRQISMADGSRMVAKVDTGTRPTLDLEARMLRYLNEYSALPVPAVIHDDPDMLLLEYIEGGGRITSDVEHHAASLLAALHAIAPPGRHDFGLDFDTLIGPLPQPNPWTSSWVAFFRDARLLPMADRALQSGHLPTSTRHAVDQIATRLDALLAEPPHPSLIHGDIWSGNVIADGERVCAFIDPSVAYAHPEIELAFITLFSTFGATFFDAYHERRPIETDFFEVRRDIYNLYPLLVHTTLFGGSYAQSVASITRRFAG